MSIDSSQRWLCGAGAVVAALSLVACNMDPQPGERARAEGRCPPGEVCSDLAPRGLAFRGARFAGIEGLWFAPTAEGGRQTFTALYGDEPQVRYVAGFDAKITDPAVATVDSMESPWVAVRGASSGKTLLRLLAPGTNELLDRIEIATAPIARTALIPLDALQDLKDETSWALLAGGKAPLGLALLDAGDQPLVDESLDVSTHGAEMIRRAWDRYDVMAAGPGKISFTVRAGNGVFAQEVSSVARVEAITESGAANEERRALEVPLRSTSERCFVARSQGKVVSGARWKFTSSEEIRADKLDTESILATPNCVKIAGLKAGRARLFVEVSDRSRVFEVTVKDQAHER